MHDDWQLVLISVSVSGAVKCTAAGKRALATSIWKLFTALGLSWARDDTAKPVGCTLWVFVNESNV